VGENASQIERQIVAERTELGRNLAVLETKARDLADWRSHYRNHPAMFLGAAAGVGLVLGAMSYGRRDTFGYVDYAHPPEPQTAKPRPSIGERLSGPKGRRLLDTLDHVTDALLAVGTAKAVDLISDYLPGFADEYQRSADASARPAAADASLWHGRAGGQGTKPSGSAPNPGRDRWDSSQDDR
jgi:hypothetical protein